jgi:hypothetical protein
MNDYLQGAIGNRPHQTLCWNLATRGAIRDGDRKTSNCSAEHERES